MTKLFTSLEEIQKYYNKKTNTYIFKEKRKYIDLVVFNFDLKINANIDAFNIEARNIKAWDIHSSDIKAWNINAWNINAVNINTSNIYAHFIEATNINAQDISYYAVCFAYNNIKCKSIKGRKQNAKHFVLDGKLEVKND